MREGIDAQLAQLDPAAHGILQQAMKANTNYKNTKNIADLIHESDLSEKLTKQQSRELGKSVKKAALDPNFNKGMGEATVASVENALKNVHPTSFLESLVAHSSLPALGGGVGYMLGGPAAAAMGAAAGGTARGVLANISRAKYTRLMKNDLRAVMAEINGMAPGPAKKKLGIMDLSPELRAAALASLATGNQ
jgi:hypothetical protein